MVRLKIFLLKEFLFRFFTAPAKHRTTVTGTVPDRGGKTILRITGCMLVLEHDTRSITSPWLPVQKSAAGACLRNPVPHKEIRKASPDNQIYSA